jgi:penicillin-binding protein 1A
MDWKDKYGYDKITSGKHVNDEKPKKGKSFKGPSQTFVIIILFVVLIAIGGAAGVVLGILDTTKDLTTDDLNLKNMTTVFLDKDGKAIGRVFGSQDRTIINLTEMSPFLPKAFVAIEDERFYEHHGIDFKRIAGAVINYFTPGARTYGASTITQQLIKNLTGEDEVTIKRKIQEQWRALDLERKMSKDQIIELYLNTIYLGEGAYGVEAAARTYLDKEAKDLTLAESALIAGITRYPNRYNPLKNFDNAKKRQEIILQKMNQLGYIDKAQMEEAIDEKIKIKKGVVKKVLRQSYFIDAVSEDIIRDLQKEKNISKVMAQKILLSDGLKVYTTEDSAIQEQLDKAYADDSSVFSQFQGARVKPQSAMVIIDYKKGRVVGMIGGRGEKEGAMTFNRATDAKRQPGSSIKPIAVYGPALDDGLVTPATVEDDVPIRLGNWTPRNWYKDGFWGLSTIRRAIENSMNIVAVRVWLKVGADRSGEFMKNLGITTLTDADKNPASMALGGLTVGVSPIEMAAAYGSIANGGYYIHPITYTRVEDRNGRVILENKPDARRVMDERAAYLLTDMLEDVVSSGTGSSARLSSMPVAGKTGTTSNNMDRWFVGYTPYYVAATWFGYDKQRVIPGNTNFSAKIWKNVMSNVHRNLANTNFEMPPGIIKKEVCIDSGKIPTNLCYRDPRGGRVRTELFISGTEPTEECDTHVRVCRASNLLATSRCPNNLVKVGIVRQKPYVPYDSDAPKPNDRKYEVPLGEYCYIHR